MSDAKLLSRVILKVKRKKSAAAEKAGKTAEDGNISTLQRSCAVKRGNPFIFDSSRKVKTVSRIVTSSGDCEVQSRAPFLEQLELYEALVPTPLNACANVEDSCRENGVVKLNNYLTIDCKLSSSTASPTIVAPASQEDSVCEATLPTDWCLKQRVRFISRFPFEPCLNIKTQALAQGVTEFVRNINGSCCQASILRYLGYWQYPLIPGVPTYPLTDRALTRIEMKSEVGPNLLASITCFQEKLLCSWKESFQSVFQLLKAGFCPYFYMVGHLFSAVFKASGLGNSKLSAVLTPTTKGLREMLCTEGILFTMPVTQGSMSNKFDDCSQGDSINEDEPVSVLDDENEEFLDSIGLSKNAHFPAMKELQRLNKKATLRKVDHRPESTIYVTGSDTHSLFNFLLNADFLCAPSGPMTGVPPSLLSPVAFEGASLRTAKFSHGPLKHQHLGESRTAYCVDVTGPVLPSQLYYLTKLFQTSQRGNLSLYVRQYANSAALNVRRTADPQHPVDARHPVDVDEQVVSNLGLSSDVYRYLCEPDCRSLPDNVRICVSKM